MKITKTYLKQIIKEELAILGEGDVIDAADRFRQAGERPAEEPVGSGEASSISKKREVMAMRYFFKRLAVDYYNSYNQMMDDPAAEAPENKYNVLKGILTPKITALIGELEAKHPTSLYIVPKDYTNEEPDAIPDLKRRAENSKAAFFEGLVSVIRNPKQAFLQASWNNIKAVLKFYKRPSKHSQFDRQMDAWKKQMDDEWEKQGTEADSPYEI